MSIKLAEAEKAFETADANWAADPVKFGLEKAKLGAEVEVKKIKFEIKEADGKTLLAQGKMEEYIQIKTQPYRLLKKRS